MYICKIIKQSVSEKNHPMHVYEKISKDAKQLLVDAKIYCKENYIKLIDRESYLGKEYSYKISSWTEVKGFKKNMEPFDDKHWYKHLVAVIIGCYGRPDYTVEIMIYKIEEIK